MGEQSSIVQELQRLAADGKADISELLRKALIVATKLKITDFRQWIEDELSGYMGRKVPEYRMIAVELRSYNPFHGWQGVAFQDPIIAKACQVRGVGGSIGEIQRLAKEGGGVVSLELPTAVVNLLRQMQSPLDAGYELRQFTSIAALQGVIEKVRTTILQWSLRLDEEGILGEGMTFSEGEKEKAAKSQGIHIENFRGVLGDVQAHNFQIGDYGSIHEQLKELGVSRDARNELEDILDELKKAKPDEKPSVMQRGLDWVGRNAPTLGALGTVIVGWFQHGSAAK